MCNTSFCNIILDQRRRYSTIALYWLLIGARTGFYQRHYGKLHKASDLITGQLYSFSRRDSGTLLHSHFWSPTKWQHKRSPPNDSSIIAGLHAAEALESSAFLPSGECAVCRAPWASPLSISSSRRRCRRWQLWRTLRNGFKGFNSREQFVRDPTSQVRGLTAQCWILSSNKAHVRWYGW